MCLSQVQFGHILFYFVFCLSRTHAMQLDRNHVTDSAPFKGLHAVRKAAILISLKNNFINFNVTANSNCGCVTELDKIIMELYQT